MMLTYSDLIEKYPQLETDLRELQKSKNVGLIFLISFSFFIGFILRGYL